MSYFIFALLYCSETGSSTEKALLIFRKKNIMRSPQFLLNKYPTKCDHLPWKLTDYNSLLSALKSLCRAVKIYLRWLSLLLRKHSCEWCAGLLCDPCLTFSLERETEKSFLHSSSIQERAKLECAVSRSRAMLWDLCQNMHLYLPVLAKNTAGFKIFLYPLLLASLFSWYIVASPQGERLSSLCPVWHLAKLLVVRWSRHARNFWEKSS
jgi:hypothetical protein